MCRKFVWLCGCCRRESLSRLKIELRIPALERGEGRLVLGWALGGTGGLITGKEISGQSTFLEQRIHPRCVRRCWRGCVTCHVSCHCLPDFVRPSLGYTSIGFLPWITIFAWFLLHGRRLTRPPLRGKRRWTRRGRVLRVIPVAMCPSWKCSHGFGLSLCMYVHELIPRCWCVRGRVTQSHNLGVGTTSLRFLSLFSEAREGQKYDVKRFFLPLMLWT